MRAPPVIGALTIALAVSGCLTPDDVQCLVQDCSVEVTRHFGDETANVDGILDADNDTVPDDADAFPRDASEYADQDGDGVGDAADDDDDDDGTPDAWDKHPWGDAHATVRLTRLEAVDACDADDATCEFVLLLSNQGGIELARWPETGSLSLAKGEAKELSETISLDVPEDMAEFVLVVELVDDDGEEGFSSVDISPDSTRRLAWTYQLGLPPQPDNSTSADRATTRDGRADGLSEVDAVAQLDVYFF